MNQPLTIDERLEGLAGQIVETKTAVGEAKTAVGEVKVAVERIAAKPKPWIERFGMFIGAGLTVISSLIMFGVGYLLKDAVDLQLRQAQLDLARAQAMLNPLQQLGTASGDNLRAASVTLAEFGPIAIGPLIRQLRIEATDNRDAAKEGLRTLALMDRPAVCAELTRILGNQRRDYPLWSHLESANLLGELRCAGSLQALTDYRDVMMDASRNMLESYVHQSQNDGRVETSRFLEIRNAVTAAIGSLEEMP